MGKYEEAYRYLHKALEQSMYDPEANYIYGVVCRKLGFLTDAKDAFGN